MEEKTIQIAGSITVDELANALGLSVTQLIGELFKNGIVATINQRLDYETASIIIDELGLSVRAYCCLKRAGIFTISDIINLPKDDWFKIKNLGRKSLEEVVEKMHSFGYEEFSVNA